MLITRLFQSDGLLVDSDGDGLMDGCRYRVLIDPRLNFREKIAIGNLAARIGFELVACNRSEFFVYDQRDSQESDPSFLITPRARQQVPRHAAWEGVLYARGDRLIATGGRGLTELLTWLSYGYPKLGGSQPTTLENLLQKRGIAAEAVTGVVVGRGKLLAVFIEDGVRTRRITLCRPLWQQGPGMTASPSARMIPGDLTGLFGPSELGGAEKPQIPIALGRAAGVAETLAACHLAWRFALERKSIRLPLVMSLDRAATVGPKLVIAVSDGDACDAQLRMNADGVISLTGNAGYLEAAARYLSGIESGPGEAGPDHSIEVWSSYLDDLFRMRSSHSALAWLWGVIDSHGDQEISTIELNSPLPLELERALARRQSQPMTIHANCSEALNEIMEFSCQWEGDALWAVIRRELPEVLSPVSGSQTMSLQVFVSEPDEIRMEMERQLRHWISTQPGNVSVRVFSGYKPGFSWIAEGLLPELSAMGAGLRKVRIYYEQFEAQDNKHYLELPSRWLQELYPIDEVIAQQTGLQLDDIEFVPVPSHECRYRVEAVDSQGAVKSWSLNCHNGERLYLDRFPEAGHVKTFTSWVALTDGQETIWSAQVPSDLERIWENYQTEVLPWLERTVAGQGDFDSTRQPFFRELSIELWASEEDKTLGIREERLSPLEAMHEEFYFTTLDWFARLGTEHCGEPFRKPGAVVPWMRKRSAEPPTLKVTLHKLSTSLARIVFGNGLKLELPPPQGATQFFLRQIDFMPTGGTLQPIPVFECEANEMALTMLRGLQTLQNLGYGSPEQGSTGCRIRILSGGAIVEEYSMASWGNAPAVQGEQQPQAGGLTNNVIDHAQLQGELRGLEASKIGRLSRVAKSFGGRSIDVIEMVAPSAKLIARAKLTAAKPTYLVMARHHANEVSSTNAALLLAKILAGEHQSLLKGINVVIIPMENPDGAELHARLAGEAPTWKHHAARFNALGEDLSAGYFQEDPTDPGSRALTRAWNLWTPDVVGDNHGVPSHEWEQPFSGYVCPWFATFWMPRAFYYGIFTYLDDPRWPEHRSMAELLRGKVADRMADREAMVQLNAVWRDRYLKYAHHPCPSKFPFDEREYCQGMIAYCSGRLQESKFISAARRFPDQTVLWWIDEVNDETAQGEYLGLCVDAHLQANLAVINTLASLPSTLTRTQHYSRTGAVLTWSRPRPLDVGQRYVKGEF